MRVRNKEKTRIGFIIILSEPVTEMMMAVAELLALSPHHMVLTFNEVSL